jgi:hypothetical protein
MYVRVAQSLLHDKGKVRGLGAIAVGVIPIVFKTFDSVVKRCLNESNIFADAGEISQLQWGTILLDDVHQGYLVKQ